MMAVGSLEIVLAKYLQKELQIGDSVIEGWKIGRELCWRAMLSLAVYETSTKEDNRAEVGRSFGHRKSNYRHR